MGHAFQQPLRGGMREQGRPSSPSLEDSELMADPTDMFGALEEEFPPTLERPFKCGLFLDVASPWRMICPAEQDHVVT